MLATVHFLHPQPSVIGGFLRVGHTGNRRLGELHAAGKLNFNWFVFDAAHIDKQVELIKALKASGCEVVLDPQFAEMAVIGKFESSVSKLPWTNANAPWKASDFGRESNLNPARLIAEFAIKHGVHTVLAPSHLVETADDAWWDVDRAITEVLRLELDRNGGPDIAIDYQVITTSGRLGDPEGREQIISAVENLPIQNVWLKISGFGATATGAGIRQLEDLSRVPELRRAEHLLLRLIDPAVRSARQIAQLRLPEGKVAKLVKDAKKRLIRLRNALGDLHARESVSTWSGPLTCRGRSDSINAVIGR